MQQRITPLNTDQNTWTPKALLEGWHRHLQEKDRSAGTVKKYTQAEILALDRLDRLDRCRKIRHFLRPT